MTDILRWHQIPPNYLFRKDDNYIEWEEIFGVDPPAFFKLNGADEAQIIDLKKR